MYEVRLLQKVAVLQHLGCMLLVKYTEEEVEAAGQPAVASPGSSQTGRDDRNNKMADNEEFRVG